MPLYSYQIIMKAEAFTLDDLEGAGQARAFFENVIETARNDAPEGAEHCDVLRLEGVGLVGYPYEYVNELGDVTLSGITFEGAIEVDLEATDENVCEIFLADLFRIPPWNDDDPLWITDFIVSPLYGLLDFLDPPEEAAEDPALALS
jgi:hypothetical protein